MWRRLTNVVLISLVVATVFLSESEACRRRRRRRSGSSGDVSSGCGGGGGGTGVTKQGTCPKFVTPYPWYPCARPTDSCRQDCDCPGIEKCCRRTFCGGYKCGPPEPVWKPGQCPKLVISDPRLLCMIPQPKCNGDYDCPKDEKCCRRRVCGGFECGPPARECCNCGRDNNTCTTKVSLSTGGVTTGIDDRSTSADDRTGISWSKPLSGSGRCSMQGVLQLDPPTWANSLTLHLTFLNPFDWSFNLGDSPTNNGYAGDAGTETYDAEMHNQGTTLKVWKNDHCGSTNFFTSLVGAVTTELTIRVSHHQLCIHNGAGGLLHKNSTCLFEFNQMYLGVNRVISSRTGGASIGRVGSGLCEVCGYWSNT